MEFSFFSGFEKGIRENSAESEAKKARNVLSFNE
jgi:hypothetical protein